MPLFKEKMWVWGHDAGQHNALNLPMPSKMTPLEGAMYLGIPNMCRIVHQNVPEPPFERDQLALDVMDKVVWSIIGDGGSSRNYGGQADVSAVAEVAKNHANVIGGIMDDFFHPPRLKSYRPEMIADFKKKLSAGAGKEMQLWTVVYTTELDPIIKPFLDEVDVATLWTWKTENLPKLEENFKKFRELWGYDKPLYGGCYLWAYGDGCVPMPLDLLQYQLDTYYSWLKAHKIDGVIFCSNTVCDIGLESVAVVKNWIAAHKDEILDF